MEKEKFIQTIKLLKEHSPKKNFKQSVDVVINLQNIDLKKQENKIDIYVPLPFTRGKKEKVCGIVGAELIEQAKKVLDTAILSDNLVSYQEKKKVRRLAKDHTYFIAQATIMPKLATVMGRVLGPRGKMPNPKAGCVVPPNANLQPLIEKLQKTVRVKVDKIPVIQIRIGTEDMPENEIAENIYAVYNAITHAMHGGENSVHEILVKYTMGTAFKVGAEKEEVDRTIAKIKKDAEEAKAREAANKQHKPKKKKSN